LGYHRTGINLVKLDPTEFARRVVEFRRQAEAGASSPLSHAERVSISDLAREASRGAGRPARGDVRWYRAVHGTPAGRLARTATGAPAARARPAASAQPAPAQRAAQSARAAIAAYRAYMPLAA